MSEVADFGRLGDGTWSVEPETQHEARLRAERLQLARELHDVVASGFTVVNFQAALAAQVLSERPERAYEALSEIRRASGEALRELRTILGILRAVEPSAAEGAPGAAAIGSLVSVTTKAGVPTRLTVSGRRRLLSADVDLAAYRIVQESLTNVLRHSGAASASVVLAYGDDRLLVEVEDDGVAAAACPSSPGHGILGMRERAAALGGEVDAGRRPQGGFRVRAELPLRGGR
jgi:signal transduction histidine kinase